MSMMPDHFAAHFLCELDSLSLITKEKLEERVTLAMYEIMPVAPQDPSQIPEFLDSCSTFAEITDRMVENLTRITPPSFAYLHNIYLNMKYTAAIAREMVNSEWYKGAEFKTPPPKHLEVSEDTTLTHFDETIFALITTISQDWSPQFHNVTIESLLEGCDDDVPNVPDINPAILSIPFPEDMPDAKFGGLWSNDDQDDNKSTSDFSTSVSDFSTSESSFGDTSSSSFPDLLDLQTPLPPTYSTSEATAPVIYISDNDIESNEADQ